MRALAVTAAITGLKMSALLAAALVAAWMLRRRSAAVRHWVLAAGIASAALLPPATAVAPRWSVAVSWLAPAPVTVTAGPLVLSSTPLDIAPSATRPAPPPARRWFDLSALVLAVWAGGAAVVLAGLGAGLVRLRVIAGRAAVITGGPWMDAARAIAMSYGLRRDVRVLQGDDPALLVTWGLLRPRVLLPAEAHDWPAERLRVVLRHELAHVARHDWAIQLGAALVSAVLWFNPLAWVAVRRLRQESECACDDIVLRGGVDGRQYAAHLLAIARAAGRTRADWIPAPAVAHPSALERRIRAMLNRTSDRRPPTIVARTAACGLALMMVITMAGGALSAAPGPLPAIAGAAPVQASVPATVPGVPTVPPPPTAPDAASGIAGVAMDQLGGLLPGVDVTLRSEATGGALVTQTDRDGRFALTGLRAGRYTLTLLLPGFRATQVPVTLNGTSVDSRVITMSIGSVQETITVVGSRQAPAAITPPLPRAPDGAGRDQRRALESLAQMVERASQFRAGTLGGQITQPTKTRHVNPVYPSALQSDGIGGDVALVATIGADGHVVEALQPRAADVATPVHPDLVTAAIDAVMRWEFTPTLLNGVPVQTQMLVTLHFSVR